jgi:hypothetical protein
MDIKWSLIASNVQKQKEGIDGYKVVLHGILLKKQY